MVEKTVKQYSGRLELPNHMTCDLVGDDPATVKETVQRILNGGARFEPSTAGPNATLIIFHPTFDKGESPIGWMSTVEVPESMTNKAVIERRLQAA